MSTPVKTAIFGELLKQQQFLNRMLKKYKVGNQYHAFYQLQLARLKALSSKALKDSELIQLPKMPPGSPI